MEVYERIRLRREELHLSVIDVADALNVSRATIYRYESAEIEKLPVQILEPLAKVLRCSPAYLMGWDDKTPFDVSSLEKEIIRKYRQLSETEQNMVLRMLGIEEKKQEENFA